MTYETTNFDARMRTATTTTHALPARLRRWTRLGAGMGYTNTETKRAAIRAAMEQMHWFDADELADVLNAYPVRLFVDGLYYGRRWGLDKAAVIAAPEFIDVGPPPGVLSQRRLIGLESVDGDRYVLLDLGHEALDLVHETANSGVVA
jgi:hypothetical protein